MRSFRFGATHYISLQAAVASLANARRLVWPHLLWDTKESYLSISGQQIGLFAPAKPAAEAAIHGDA